MFNQAASSRVVQPKFVSWPANFYQNVQTLAYRRGNSAGINATINRNLAGPTNRFSGPNYARPDGVSSRRSRTVPISSVGIKDFRNSLSRGVDETPPRASGFPEMCTARRLG